MHITARCFFCWDLTKLCAQWNALTVHIMLAARKDRDVVSSASVDFLMFSGYVMMAYFWAQQAAVVSEKLASGDGKESAEAMVNPSKTMTSLATEHFSFDY